MNFAKKPISATLAFPCLMLCLACLQTSAAAPVNLRCTQRVNSLGSGDMMLRLSWRLPGNAPLRGEFQRRKPRLSATRVAITPETGLLAGNVAAIKFDSTTPNSEINYCGYGELTVFGSASVVPPVGLSVIAPVGNGQLALNHGGLFTGQNYQLQSTANLALPSWFAKANFVATQATVAWTNLTSNVPQKFYREVAF